MSGHIFQDQEDFKFFSKNMKKLLAVTFLLV
jgi:hypothetical protein